MREPRARSIAAFFTHALNLAVIHYSGGVDGFWVGAQGLYLKGPAWKGMGELIAHAMVTRMREVVDRRSLTCVPQPTLPYGLLEAACSWSLWADGKESQPLGGWWLLGLVYGITE